MYSHYGFHEFVICCGYKQHVIKEWFADYYLHNSNITFDFTQENKMIVHNHHMDPWKVTLVDTGLHTMTGGRIRRVRDYLDGETFMLTYGDGVADVDVSKLLEFHRSHGKMLTLTAVQPGGRFGVLDIREDGGITNFREKKKEDEGWINAGFMVVEPQMLDLIEGDDTVFEKYPMEEAARRGELNAYKHHGFWQCMDTLREKNMLETLWQSGQAPWKIWE
jgi:glucose-1-phosphate cytidylyltransferase